MSRAKALSTPRRRHLVAVLGGLGADPAPADGQAGEWRWRRCPGCGVTFLGAQERCMVCREGLAVIRDEDEDAGPPVLTREALLARAGRTVGEVMAEFRSSGRYIQARAAEWGVEIVDGVIMAPEAAAEKWPVSPERLRELYLGDGLTSRQIAERLGVAEHLVKGALTRYGIRRRASGARRKAQDVAAQALTPPARVLIAISRTDTPEDCAPVLEHLRVMLQEMAPLVRRIQIEVRVEAAG